MPYGSRLKSEAPDVPMIAASESEAHNVVPSGQLYEDEESLYEMVSPDREPSPEVSVPDGPEAVVSAVVQEPPASLLTCLSPLSPIREVAEGSTPKTIDVREVLEPQALALVREVRAVCAEMPSRNLVAEGHEAWDGKEDVLGQQDLQDQQRDASEDLAANPVELPSSKERYLQIRDRFLAK
jgi:hypothetical protein